MKLFAALASLAAAAQYQGTNSDGTEWSASVTDDNFAFQENGESLVAEGSEPSDAGLINFNYFLRSHFPNLKKSLQPPLVWMGD